MSENKEENAGITIPEPDQYNYVSQYATAGYGCGCIEFYPERLGLIVTRKWSLCKKHERALRDILHNDPEAIHGKEIAEKMKDEVK